MNLTTPTLYSFRRCPYAIRARMGIIFAQQSVDLIEIDLKNKLEEFLTLSPKGTVPVLKVNEDFVLEESLDIMQWAFDLNNPSNIRIKSYQHDLIEENDETFKDALDHYKYAVRFPEHSMETYQQRASEFPNRLNTILKESPYLTGNEISTVDIAIFPFIRQFSFVDKKWFDQQPWPHLQRWLNFWLEHDVFKQAFAWGR